MDQLATAAKLAAEHGATRETHNMGGLHQEIWHRTQNTDSRKVEDLPEWAWAEALEAHKR